MTTGDNDEAQAPDLPETEDENHQNDRTGDQEELLDDQGKTEPRQNDARGYQSPISITTALRRKGTLITSSWRPAHALDSFVTLPSAK